METKQEFTKDGSVDLRGRPVLASRTGRWKACAFLVGYEAFERMAFYGVASNLVVYLTTQLREETVSSVRNVNNWTGSVWMTPIVGAYIADTFLGRFWTFTISSLIYLSAHWQRERGEKWSCALSCAVASSSPAVRAMARLEGWQKWVALSTAMPPGGGGGRRDGRRWRYTRDERRSSSGSN